METRKTLQDLTGRESGIIVYGDRFARFARVVNWASSEGIPYDSAIGEIDIPREIPEVEAEEQCDLEWLLGDVELDRGSLPDDEELPRAVRPTG